MTRREPYDHMGAERRSYTILWQVSTGMYSMYSALQSKLS